MGAFHEGEQAVRAQAGVRERSAPSDAPFLRDFMPEQHREFFSLLPFILAGSIDAQGQPHATVLAGPPGFAHSPDPRVLEVLARPRANDPLAASLRPGAPIGLLGIQPHTRRRNRLNGHLIDADPAGFRVRVDQSFGNCPKYIQAREPYFAGAPSDAPRVTRMAALDEAAQRLVRDADTLFIASAHPRALDSKVPEHGVDVSHRGGKPGFVRVDDPTLLTLPDFIGNFYFNTLGNLLLHPHCGLLFIDFNTGDTLQVTGRARITTDGNELASAFATSRLVHIEVAGALRAERAVPLRWGPAELSPVLDAKNA